MKENWKDKLVRNPETGNKVKVSSLPPKLQLRYKPKEEEPIGMKLDMGGRKPSPINDSYTRPFLQAGLKKKDIQNILPALMKSKEWSDTSILINNAFKKVNDSLPSVHKNEESFMESKFYTKQQKLKFLAVKESAQKMLDKAQSIRQKMIQDAIKKTKIATACLKMETGMSLDIPFSYHSLEDTMWKIKAQEAEKVFKIRVPIDSNFTGERQIISFQLPGEKELSLDDMLAGRKDPLYWQFGVALYRSPDETLAHFRCQIHDNTIQLPGKLCVAAKEDSWFVYPVPNNRPSSKECWTSVENYLQSLIEEHIQKRGPNLVSGGVVTAGTNLIKKSKSANRKEDGDIFGYDSVINEIWNDRVRKAKDYFLTEFDLENNDSAKERRLITFTIPDDDTYPTEFQFACSLWKAGGDWENLVAYFRCQLVDGSMTINNKDFYPREPNPYKDPWFVVVPPASAGNAYLIQYKGSNKNAGKTMWGPLSNNSSVPQSMIDELEHDHRGMWKWLEDYLMKVVEKYLLLKELEKDIYDKNDGKIGYEDASDEAIKKMISEAMAHEPFSFCTSCGWKGSFVIKGDICPDCCSTEVVSTFNDYRLYDIWKSGLDKISAQDVIPRPYEVQSEFDNASLFIEVPDELTSWVQQTAKAIPEKLLTPEGIEDETHVTLLYGVPDEGDIIGKIQKLIDRRLRISNEGKVTYFDNGYDFDGSGASVAKIDVKSTDLRWTHAVLKSLLPNKHKHFFNPHITIAYLKSNERLCHVNDVEVPIFHWVIDEVMLGHRDGSVEKIRIGENIVKATSSTAYESVMDLSDDEAIMRAISKLRGFIIPKGLMEDDDLKKRTASDARHRLAEFFYNEVKKRLTRRKPVDEQELAFRRKDLETASKTLFKVQGSSLKYTNNVDKYSDAAYKLAKQENIGIMRNRDLYTVVLDGNNVVGALWIVEDSQEFTFDVVVEKEHQRKGIGKKLIEEAINAYKQGGYEEVGAKFVVDSVNKNLVPYLKSKGFNVSETEGGHTILEYMR